MSNAGEVHYVESVGEEHYIERYTERVNVFIINLGAWVYDIHHESSIICEDDEEVHDVIEYPERVPMLGRAFRNMEIVKLNFENTSYFPSLIVNDDNGRSIVQAVRNLNDTSYNYLFEQDKEDESFTNLVLRISVGNTFEYYSNNSDTRGFKCWKFLSNLFYDDYRPGDSQANMILQIKRWHDRGKLHVYFETPPEERPNKHEVRINIPMGCFSIKILQDYEFIKICPVPTLDYFYNFFINNPNTVIQYQSGIEEEFLDSKEYARKKYSSNKDHVKLAAEKIERKIRTMENNVGSKRKKKRKNLMKKAKHLHHQSGAIQAMYDAIPNSFETGIDYKKFLMILEKFVFMYIAKCSDKKVFSLLSTILLFFNQSISMEAISRLESLFSNFSVFPILNMSLANFKEFLSNLSLNWNTLRNNSYATSFFSIIASICSVILCPTLATVISTDTILAIGKYIASIKETNLISTVIDAMLYISNGVSKFITTGSLEGFLFTQDDFSQLMQEVEELKIMHQKFKLGTLGRDLTIPVPSLHFAAETSRYTWKLDHCLERIGSLLKSANNKQKKDLHAYRVQLSNMKDELELRLDSTSTRICPYGFLLSSESGINKSHLCKIFAHTIAKANNIPTGGAHEYVKNLLDSFDSGKTNAETIRYYDDVANAIQAQGDPSSNFGGSYLRVHNNTKSSSVMPGLDEKGKIFETALVVSVNTNTCYLDLSALNNYPTSQLRRFEAHIYGKVRNEFRKTPGPNIDYNKVPDEEKDSIAPDLWSFDVCICELRENTYGTSRRGPKLDFNATAVEPRDAQWRHRYVMKDAPLRVVLQWLRDDSQQYFNLQQHVLTVDGKLYEENSWCDKCKLPSNICVCNSDPHGDELLQYKEDALQYNTHHQGGSDYLGFADEDTSINAMIGFIDKVKDMRTVDVADSILKINRVMMKSKDCFLEAYKLLESYIGQFMAAALARLCEIMAKRGTLLLDCLPSMIPSSIEGSPLSVEIYKLYPTVRIAALCDDVYNRCSKWFHHSSQAIRYVIGKILDPFKYLLGFRNEDVVMNAFSVNIAILAMLIGYERHPIERNWRDFFRRTTGRYVLLPLIVKFYLWMALFQVLCFYTYFFCFRKFNFQFREYKPTYPFSRTYSSFLLKYCTSEGYICFNPLTALKLYFTSNRTNYYQESIVELGKSFGSFKDENTIPFRDEYGKEALTMLVTGGIAPLIYKICSENYVRLQGGLDISRERMEQFDKESLSKPGPWFKHRVQVILDPAPVEPKVAFEELAMNIGKNTIYIVDPKTKKCCNGLLTSTEFFLMPGHICNELLEKGNTAIHFCRKERHSIDGKPIPGNAVISNVPITKLNTTEIPGKDTVLVRTVRTGSVTSIIKYFPDTHVYNIPNGMMFYRDKHGVLKNIPTKDMQYSKTAYTTPAQTYEGYNYTCDNFDGLCGSPIIDVTRKHSFIVGFHNAGDEQSKVSGAQYITKYELEKAMERVGLVPHQGGFNMDNIDMDIFDDSLHVNSPLLSIPKEIGMISVLGSTNNRSTPKNKIQKTLICDRLKEKLKHKFGWEAPPLMGPKGDDKRYPLRRFLDIFSEKEDNIDMVALQWAKSDYLCPLMKNIMKAIDRWRDELYVLNIEQNIQGVEGKKFLNGLNMSTSAGKVGFTGKKSDHGWQDADGRWHLKDYIVSEFYKRDNMWRKGQRTFEVSFMIPKVEPTALRKVQKGKCRVFFACGIVTQMLIRKYALTTIRTFCIMTSTTEVAVGIDPHSRRWHETFKWFNTFKGSNYVGFDFPSFDICVSPEVMEVALDIIFTPILTIAKLDEGDKNAIAVLKLEILHAVIDMNGDLTIITSIITSGNNLTSLIGCVVNSLYMRTAFYVIFKGQPDVLTKGFQYGVLLLTFGDDSIGKVKDNNIYRKYNVDAVIRALNKMGVKVSNCHKDSRRIIFYGIADLCFLKRYFVFISDFGVYVAPLEIESIIKQLSVMLPPSSDGCNVRSITASNIDGALYELKFHGRAVYNKYNKVLNELAGECGLTHYCRLLGKSYDDMVSDWKIRYKADEDQPPQGFMSFLYNTLCNTFTYCNDYIAYNKDDSQVGASVNFVPPVLPALTE